MKSMLSLIACCCVIALAGCKSDDSMSASPGAMSGTKAECSANGECCKAKSDANMGAVGSCDAAKSCGSSCTQKTDANMGAVSGCSESKSSCESVCPVTGQTKSDTNMGAVSEKSGCCSKGG